MPPPPAHFCPPPDPTGDCRWLLGDLDAAAPLLSLHPLLVNQPYGRKSTSMTIQVSIQDGREIERRQRKKEKEWNWRKGLVSASAVWPDYFTPPPPIQRLPDNSQSSSSQSGGSGFTYFHTRSNVSMPQKFKSQLFNLQAVIWRSSVQVKVLFDAFHLLKQTVTKFIHMVYIKAILEINWTILSTLYDCSSTAY